MSFLISLRKSAGKRKFLLGKSLFLSSPYGYTGSISSDSVPVDSGLIRLGLAPWRLHDRSRLRRNVREWQGSISFHGKRDCLSIESENAVLDDVFGRVGGGRFEKDQLVALRSRNSDSSLTR